MMQIKKTIHYLAIVLLIALASCIKPYEPEFDNSDIQRVVISGKLLDVAGIQEVDISLSSPLKTISRIPYEKCTVNLLSSKGKQWTYTEAGDGVYRLILNAGELDLSISYHIEVETPDHQIIVSAPEIFYENPDVDSIYFSKETHANEITGKEYLGLQFLIDLKAAETDSRYYLFDVIETSEFHAPRPIEWWYDGVVHHEDPADYSKSLCWNTQDINDVFVLKTDNLSKNEYIGSKLNFTNNQSQRLQHLYSLNVKQYSISKEAYTYWSQMQINMHQSGGLYNSQPIAPKGNFSNKGNPEREVLGYFMLAKLKEKRIFVSPQNIDIVDNTCGEPAVLRFGLRDISPLMYPAYLDGNQLTYFNRLLDKGCVDCTSDGGSTIKPGFWPN